MQEKSRYMLRTLATAFIVVGCTPAATMMFSIVAPLFGFPLDSSAAIFTTVVTHPEFMALAVLCLAGCYVLDVS